MIAAFVAAASLFTFVFFFALELLPDELEALFGVEGDAFGNRLEDDADVGVVEDGGVIGIPCCWIPWTSYC